MGRSATYYSCFNVESDKCRLSGTESSPRAVQNTSSSQTSRGLSVRYGMLAETQVMKVDISLDWPRIVPIPDWTSEFYVRVSIPSWCLIDVGLLHADRQSDHGDVRAAAGSAHRFL